MHEIVLAPREFPRAELIQPSLIQPSLIQPSLIQPSLFEPGEVIEAEIVEQLENPGDFFLAARSAPLSNIDVLALFLRTKTNPSTRRAYQGALGALFGFLGVEATPARVLDFLGLRNAHFTVLHDNFRAHMLENKLAHATIKMRLAAFRSFLSYAHSLDICCTDGRHLKDKIKVETFRDTRGIDGDKIEKLLKAPARLYGARSIRALRDEAMLALMVENGLRRAEVCKLNVGDFVLEEMRLSILGKGRGTQREWITLSGDVAETILAYLRALGHEGDKGPLFRNLDRNPEFAGERLTSDALYKIVGAYGRAIKLKIHLRPHKLRHSCITNALDAGFAIRDVQKLARHKNPEMTMRYDDNLADLQGKCTNTLADLYRKRKPRRVQTANLSSG